jgi:hypothetical protein
MNDFFSLYLILPAALGSRQCGVLNISQSYRPPRPVRGIALLLIIRSDIDWMVMRTFGPKRDEVTGGCKNCITRTFITRTLRLAQLLVISTILKEDEMGRACSTN